MELNREMTNEEAIEWLVAIEEKYIHGGDEGFDNQRRTALHSARNALALIKQLAEDGEVVRCKDCIYYKANSCFNRQWDFESSSEIPMVRDCDFCSYGERKEK